MVLKIFVPVFLFDFKVVVRAVVIKHFIVSFSDEMTVLIDLSLDKVTILSKYIQGAVNVVKSVSGDWLGNPELVMGSISVAVIWTKGGPLNYSETIALRIYRYAFQETMPGKGMALAIMLTIFPLRGRHSVRTETKLLSEQI